MGQFAASGGWVTRPDDEGGRAWLRVSTPRLRGTSWNVRHALRSAQGVPSKRDPSPGRARGVAVFLLAVLLSGLSARGQEPARPQPAKAVDRLTVMRKLDATVNLDVDAVPLREYVEKLAKEHDLEIRINEASLKAAGVATDVPITAKIKEGTLQSALGGPLNKQGLTFGITAQGLQVVPTAQRLRETREAAKAAEDASVRGKLRARVSVDFDDVPLREFAKKIGEQHGIDLRIDEARLREAGVSLDVPISVKAEDQPLSTVLSTALRKHGLLLALNGESAQVTARVAPQPAPARAVAPQQPPVDLKQVEAQLTAIRPALERVVEQGQAEQMGQIQISRGFTIEFVRNEPMPVVGSDDVIVDPAQAAAPKMRFRLAADTFDNWVSGISTQAGNADRQDRADELRSRLQEFVRRRILAIDRICKLSDSQKRKLELAGRGEVHVIAARYEELRKEFERVRDDQAKAFATLELARPLQGIFHSGSFDSETLFEKVLRSTLTPEQVAEYDRHFGAKAIAK